MAWEHAAAIAAVAAVAGVAFPAVASATPGPAPESPATPTEQPAPQLVEPVNSIVALLPPEMRQQAATDLVRAIPALEAPPAPVAPDVPPVPPPAPEPSPPVAEPSTAPAPVVTTPAPAPAVTVPGLGSLTLPPLPAILPPNSVLGQVGSVAVFAPWLRQGGEICDGVSAPTLAALLSVENDFRFGPTAPMSLAGGRGPAKFMPSEWAKYGRDADGDGTADILGVGDSVMAAGHMLCDNYAQMEAWKQDGVVQGDTLDLALAAFNAGTRAVRKAGGVPSGADDAADLSGPYVHTIRGAEAHFDQLLAQFANVDVGFTVPTTGLGGAAVQLAMRFLGLPYVWGGGNISGPTMGGFDCSGLTSAAVFAASGGRVVLPRTSETQWHVGTEIPMAAAAPGDLVFGNWQAAGPGHVGIYMGNGLMVHAPTFGDVVKVGPVFADMKARRVM